MRKKTVKDVEEISDLDVLKSILPNILTLKKHIKKEKNFRFEQYFVTYKKDDDIKKALVSVLTLELISETEYNGLYKIKKSDPRKK